MDAGTDTIVAIATPPGRGGLAVVRLSGPKALEIAAMLAGRPGGLEPRRATLTTLVLDTDGEAMRDEAILTAFPGPSSYTGEDVVEASLHGSPLLATRLVGAAIRAGARHARAGEFTLRAFLNGRLDLAQAEAVRDLVNATTPVQARLAYDQLQGTLSERLAAIERELFELPARIEASLDFPDEGFHFAAPAEIARAVASVKSKVDALVSEGSRGRLLREGATIAIAGRTNVGKSTLFNRLAGAERAIVTEIPGTTRDLLTETLSIAGVPVTLVDTAGVRDTADRVEREGVARAARAREAAELVIVVLDGSEPLQAEDENLLQQTAPRRRLVVVNKIDREAAWEPGALGRESGGRAPILVAAAAGTGVDALCRAIGEELGVDAGEERLPALSNLRHLELLRRAAESLGRLLGQLTEVAAMVDEADVGQMPEEIVLAELQDARCALEEVTGRRTTEDLLQEIFSRFCVGK